MDLKQIAADINGALEQRRKEIKLSFIEEKHIYWMQDVDGKIKKSFPSVSKVVGLFHEPFDAPKKALEMAKGDVQEQQRLLLEWKTSGNISTNLGSRSHFFLESDLVARNGSYKEVRQPIFRCDEEQIAKSDRMIIAGKQYLDLMEERGAVLLDTEMVLGDPELGYTGQPDKGWLMMNKDKSNYGLVITDWKTNQPKNFVPQWYNKYLFPPFQAFRDFALGHYQIQLPLYAKLLIKMLQNTPFADIKLLGGVIILLKEDGTYEEFRVPAEMNQIIMNMDIKKYLKK